MSWTAPRTWVTGEVVTASVMNVHVRDNLNALAPTGKWEFFAQAATAVETLIGGKWLEANGVTISRVTYSGLWTYANALIGAGHTLFGTGDGVTTFTLPDMRGRVPWNMGTNAAVDALGDGDGVAVANRRPQHRHTAHSHVINVGNTGSGGNTSGAGSGPGVWTDLATSSVDGGSGTSTDALNAPAYLTAGVWAVTI